VYTTDLAFYPYAKVNATVLVVITGITNHHKFNDFKNFLFYFYYHIIAILGVHCDIYKSAYNTS
jgi:hypothetical protein